MNKRMWIAVGIGIFVFLAVTAGLFFNYRYSSQLEVPNIEAQLARDAQLPADRQLNAKDRLELENQLALRKEWQGQLWGLLGTDTFKTVAISLLLAVVLTAIGGFFKIDRAIEDRIRAEKQKRIDAQRKCIELTSGMWNELYCLTSEVRFFKKEENDKETIEDILIKMENFTSHADDIINMWYFNFPMLLEVEGAIKKERGKEIRASDLFVYLMNVLYDSSISVAYRIQKGYEKRGDTSLRDSLGVIQDAIETIAHHPIISILKRSIEPLEGYGTKKQKEEAMARTRGYLYYLAYVVTEIKKFEKRENALLPIIKTGKIADFRKEAGDFEEWEKKAENRERSFLKYGKFGDFEESFYEIEEDDFVRAWEIRYSPTYLKKLARWLGFLNIMSDLWQRAALLSSE
jgi:hypothetical protein